MPPDKSGLSTLLVSIAEKYPTELVAAQIRDVPRIAFNINLVLDRAGWKIRICDLGGGIGLCSVGCAAMGMQSTLVDDFSDSVNLKYSQLPFQLHPQFGVDVVNADIIAVPPPFPDESYDAVTTFDSMEHWHHSPKQLLRKVMKWLKPGGLFVLGVPNCVNLRKRLTVPVGVGK